MAKTPGASNSNTCDSSAAPCLTIQGAVNKVPGGSLGVRINVGAGTYNESVNIYYHRAMEIRGDCSNLSAVQIVTTSVAFSIQDKVIVILHCFTISTSVAGATGIHGRQEPIIDISQIRFGGFPSGVHISMQERSKLSCLPGPNGEPIIVTGSGADVFAAANQQTQLFLNCPISFEGSTGQTYIYFTQCEKLSLCEYTGLAWTGLDVTGKQFYCDNSDLTQPAGSPPSGYFKSFWKGYDNADFALQDTVV